MARDQIFHRTLRSRRQMICRWNVLGDSAFIFDESAIVIYFRWEMSICNDALVVTGMAEIVSRNLKYVRLIWEHERQVTSGVVTWSWFRSHHLMHHVLIHDISTLRGKDRCPTSCPVGDQIFGFGRRLKILMLWLKIIHFAVHVNWMCLVSTLVFLEIKEHGTG